MKQLTAAFLLCLFLFCACKKSSKQETGKVNIRIENAAGISLEDVKISNAAYGNVSTGTVTGYMVVTTPIYAGYCNFRINNQDAGAGYGVCGTPPPPAFPPGYYTFKVEPLQNYFTVVVTKD